MESLSTFLCIFIISFFLGSIPSGEIIGRIFFSKDIRETGSGNIGTTNAIRALGKTGGIAVFLLDFAKGIVASLIAVMLCSAHMMPQGGQGLLVSINDCLAVSFLGAAYGHIFCPWLKFHGGKGIAVSVGSLFIVFGPIGALIELFGFVVVCLFTKYVSAGSLTAACICPFLALWIFWGDWIAVALCTIVALTVIWAHRSNIDRLRSGTENRIGSQN